MQGFEFTHENTAFCPKSMSIFYVPVARQFPDASAMLKRLKFPAEVSIFIGLLNRYPGLPEYKTAEAVFVTVIEVFI